MTSNYFRVIPIHWFPGHLLDGISPGLPSPSAITVSQEAEIDNDGGVHVKGGRDGPLTHCRCACCAHMSSECIGSSQTWKQQIAQYINYKVIEQFVLQQ